MKNNLSYDLAKEISNMFCEINNNKFNKYEIEEGIQEYTYMLNNGQKYVILNLLNEEIKDGNKDALRIAEKILAF